MGHYVPKQIRTTDHLSLLSDQGFFFLYLIITFFFSDDNVTTSWDQAVKELFREFDTSFSAMDWCRCGMWCGTVV